MSNVNVPIPETVTTEAAPAAPEQKKASVAYDAVFSEIEAVPQDEVLRVNLDISRAVSRVLGALPAINALRPQMTTLPGFDASKHDKLETYALAAWYAHILAMPPSSTDSPLQPLLVEAAPLRDDMLKAAEMLAHFGIFDQAHVDDIRRGSGYIDVANDLVSLHAIFKKKWSEVAAKTPITPQQVDRAEELGTEVLTKLGARLQPNGEPIITGEAVARRARAFTLFMGAYDRVRRHVSFLRWDDGDAELIAPSVFMKSAKRKAVAPAEPVTEEVAAVVTPPPANPAPPTPAPPTS